KAVHTVFNNENNNIKVEGCTYLHNYIFQENDSVLDDKFNDVCRIYPLFSRNETKKLEQFIGNKVGNGKGTDILKKIECGKFKPDKKLMNHVSDVIKGLPQYVL
ncbi:hypothetical protein KFV96_28345, partial [Klebsiella pneumoniae]|nr:hypothetical protein [Klebsiella pneumoniae]